MSVADELEKMNLAPLTSPVIWKLTQFQVAVDAFAAVAKSSQHMAPEARFVAEMAVWKSSVHSVMNFEAVLTLPSSFQSFTSQVTPEAGFRIEFVFAMVNLGTVVGATLTWLSLIATTFTSLATKAVPAVVADDLHTNDVLLGVVNLPAI